MLPAVGLAKASTAITSPVCRLNIGWNAMCTLSNNAGTFPIVLRRLAARNRIHTLFTALPDVHLNGRGDVTRCSPAVGR
jgi:hypothetical protein